METGELLTMNANELIKFVILALIVVIIAVVARRGQAHSTGGPPQKPDPVTEDDADHVGDGHSAAADQGTRTAGEPTAKRRERRRRR